jgi:pimeloyl-ACP methyl ester carboxylesterase
MHAALAGSTLEIIPGTGHLSVLECPEAVNAAMSRWLAA